MEILDLSQLRRYTLGDTALEAEVLGLFADQSQIYLDALVYAGDWKGWNEAAHSLRGSAGAIGAGKVVAAAARAEQIAHFGDKEKRADLLGDVQFEIKRVNEAISRHLRQSEPV